MLRQSLLFLSESAAMRRMVSENPASRRIASRFVAGNTLDDAIRSALELNDAGLKVSLDHLGEAVERREEAIAATDAAVEAIEAIAAYRLDANISLKPTQLGLAIDEDFCLENVTRILERARGLGAREDEIFVRLDMESSEFTESTIRLVETLWEHGYRNVGTVVQAYLHRTRDDIERLNRLGCRVRLVKGAYHEPASIAYTSKDDVDREFIAGMQKLLVEGQHPAIATHDEAMISATRRFAFEHRIQRETFEFQMLYGIRRDLQQRLREEGYTVRVYLPYGDSWYPYLMRRMAERPANFFFVMGSLAKESPGGILARPAALGAGIIAGSLATLALRNRMSR